MDEKTRFFCFKTHYAMASKKRTREYLSMNTFLGNFNFFAKEEEVRKALSEVPENYFLVKHRLIREGTDVKMIFRDPEDWDLDMRPNVIQLSKTPSCHIYDELHEVNKLFKRCYDAGLNNDVPFQPPFLIFEESMGFFGVNMEALGRIDGVEIICTPEMYIFTRYGDGAQRRLKVSNFVLSTTEEAYLENGHRLKHYEVQRHMQKIMLEYDCSQDDEYCQKLREEFFGYLGANE